MKLALSLILLSLLAATPAEARPRCVFGIFCSPVHHYHHKKHVRKHGKHVKHPAAATSKTAPAKAAEPDDDATSDLAQAAGESKAAPSKYCTQIALAYVARKGSRDDFIKSFPASKQRRILTCVGDAP